MISSNWTKKKIREYVKSHGYYAQPPIVDLIDMYRAVYRDEPSFFHNEAADIWRHIFLGVFRLRITYNSEGEIKIALVPKSKATVEVMK